MPLKANLNTFAMMLVSSLVMASTTFAEMLIPIHVGKHYEYESWLYGGEENKWTAEMEFVDKTTYNLIDYYLLQVTNYNNDSVIEDGGYRRSTEEAVYGYNPYGDDYLQLKQAPVGTKWTSYEPHSSGYDYKVIEIVAIERVTVPYGTFNKAYKHRKFRCVDPANLSLGCSPDYYEWVVPGIGLVKEVDYWVRSGMTPPLTVELVDVSSPLEVNMAATLAFFNESVRNKTLVGVGKGGKKQLNALKNMLETASELIKDGYNGQACEKLSEAYAGCDSVPPDMVAGSATVELAVKIQEVIDGLECQ